MRSHLDQISLYLYICILFVFFFFFFNYMIISLKVIRNQERPIELGLAQDLILRQNLCVVLKFSSIVLID